MHFWLTLAVATLGGRRRVYDRCIEQGDGTLARALPRKVSVDLLERFCRKLVLVQQALEVEDGSLIWNLFHPAKLRELMHHRRIA